jgi:malto-oligosyltrehalose trehalohydrolase
MLSRSDAPPGATQSSDSSTFFKVWAPKRNSVGVELGENTHPLEAGDDGWFAGNIENARAGNHYRFLLDGEISRPDPTSRFQPEGVHGPSQIIDPTAYRWRCPDWKGIAARDLVIYEIHVGTFTDPGTYRAAIGRLDELVDLGATALEIMPVAQCPGRWNWGYDGVNLFAPAHPYGHPDDLKALVDACHQRGLAVLLDVVYNHLGPEGNYLADFGPYHSRKHRTPWGPAFNFDGRKSRPVRDFVLQNMRYWMDEFHLDGLRVDAIRSMRDDSEPSILEEMGTFWSEMQAATNRPLHLIAEANIHYPELIDYGFTANWNDEIPHALLAILSGQKHIANRDYHFGADLERCLRNGYVYRHRESDHAELREEGGSAADHLTNVHGLQTHDQVGNHPLGQRLLSQVGSDAQRAAAALALLHPATPFVFMGEEFSDSPFCFFVDYGDAHLQRATVAGRKREYAHHDWAEFVSPMSEEAFLRSKLPALETGNLSLRSWYRELLRIRREWLDAGILAQKNLTVSHRPECSEFTLDYGTASVTSILPPPNSDATYAVRIARDGNDITPN